MNHPLDGARLKIIRAQEHLDTLKKEIGDYLNTKPYDFPVQTDGDVVTAHQAVVTNPPPLRLSAIMGDCVCNLMAALDYIVWELASKHAGRPLIPPPGGTDKPSFPLFVDRARFSKNVDRLTQYKIPGDATTGPIGEITRVQPWNAGHQVLAALHRLVNQDKHRLPLFTISDVGTNSIQINVNGRLSAHGSAVSSISVNAASPLIPANRTREVQVDGDTLVFVTFQDIAMPREPVGRMLEQIIDAVAHVIPRFDQFF